MALSHTKRKRSRKHNHRPLLDHPEVNSVLTQAVKFLHRWTQKELTKLSQAGQTVIVQGKNKDSYIIGKYQLIKRNEHCWTVNITSDKVQDFFDRRSAVLYCMSTQNNYSKHAEDIRLQDAEVGTLWQNHEIYQTRLQSARKTRNWVLYDVMQARIAEISSKLDLAQERLEKSLRWAKYIKTQDQTYETTRTRN